MIDIIKDSVLTSISLKIYKSIEDASIAHIFDAKKSIFIMSKSKLHKLNNFSTDRLQKTPALAYPINDRPRKDSDLSSVIYWKNIYKKLNGNVLNTSAIIIHKPTNTLLDGAHRIVAANILGIKELPCYYIGK
jgi:hypothetical protein